MSENDYEKQTPEDFYRCGKQYHPNLDHIRTPEMVKKLCEKADIKTFEKDGYQLKAGHFPPFWFYGNSTIKQNLRS